MKYEIKIEYTKTKELKRLLEGCYVFNKKIGNINNSEKHLEITPSDMIFNYLKGLNNMTIRIFNDDIIDGTCRFVIDESEDIIKLIPCSIYCTIEHGKYSFY